MRGIALVFITLVVVIIGTMVGITAVQPLGEHIKTYDSIDSGELNGTSVINDVYNVVFKFMFLIVFGGMLLGGAAWYLRRERRTRRGGGGLP